MIAKYSTYIFIAGVVGFGVFVVWSLSNSSFLAGILRNTDNITVTGTNGASNSGQPRDLELVTLLPFDAIRSIESPVFLDRTTADQLYDPDELVLGIDIDGDRRAYSVPLLSRHEVVNDVVGGKPIAVTW